MYFCLHLAFSVFVKTNNDSQRADVFTSINDQTHFYFYLHDLDVALDMARFSPQRQ